MKIKFINHASYILEHREITLIVDPWIEGSAFHDGWSHIEVTKFSYEDFSQITHIWFSHEHPDHFSPTNLKQIPETIRSNITILYQKSEDGKVVDFCKKLKFKQVIELDKNWFDLAPDFKILNILHTDGDSWLCVKSENKIILNINDCVIENKIQATKIKSLIGQNSIDLLFTQFSYANWAGNKEDSNTRKQFAQKKLEQIKYQVETFNPKYTIPFASFVWFSHEENFYMNDEINKIENIETYIKNNLSTIPIVMFPSEDWILGEPYDNNVSIKNWMNSYNSNITIENTIKTKSVEQQDLINQGMKFIEVLKSNNTFWIYLFLKPSFIHITDYEKSFKLDLKEGFVLANKNSTNCDISLSSDALSYCFNFLWGGSTTRINGRFQIPEKGIFYNWKMYFQTSQLNNLGKKFDLYFVIDSLKRKITRKFAS